MGKKSSIVFIDSHVLMWLYDALTDRISPAAVEALNRNSVYISAAVKLELQYWYGARKIKEKPAPIIGELARTLGLKMAETAFNDVVDRAIHIQWTRDPFDKLITADAMIHNVPLITANNAIRSNYEGALW